MSNSDNLFNFDDSNFTNDFFNTQKYYFTDQKKTKNKIVSITNAYELIPKPTQQNPTAFSLNFNVTDDPTIHELMEKHIGILEETDQDNYDIIAFVFKWHKDEYNKLNAIFNKERKQKAYQRLSHQLKHNLHKTFKQKWYKEDFMAAYNQLITSVEFLTIKNRYIDVVKEIRKKLRKQRKSH